MYLRIKYLCPVALTLLTLLTFNLSPAEACSCQPQHPQQHFCNADYVVIIRVLRKSHNLVANKVAYKVEVKKSYKMNPAAHKMLKHGRILTPDMDSMCGVKLELGKLYMIAGRAPRLTACSYVKEYMKMTVIERRGFTGVYNKGCGCNIRPCFDNRCFVEQSSPTYCMWSPWGKCEAKYSACMPASWRTPEGIITKCQWRKTKSYKACMTDP